MKLFAKKKDWVTAFPLKIGCEVFQTLSECNMQTKMEYAEAVYPVFHREIIREYDRWGELEELPKVLKAVITENRGEFIELVESGRFDLSPKIIRRLKSKKYIKTVKIAMLMWLYEKDERFSGRIVNIILPREER